MISTLSLNRGKIINDGSLILHLDAANPDSYPGSGNIWYDLTKYKQEITLFNSPTFNNSGAGFGSFQFNGSNQFASGSLTPGLTNLPYTISSWLYSTSIPDNFATYWVNLESVFNGAFAAIYAPSGAFYSNITPGELVFYSNLNDQKINGFWYNLTWTVTRNEFSSPTTYNRGYLNGQQILLDSANYTTSSVFLSPSNKIKIGGSYPYPNSNFSGSISTLSIYNRELSNQEVLQNFNAIKNRFGYF